jgi:tetratricopeptide (TPR) repeat protein
MNQDRRKGQGSSRSAAATYQAGLAAFERGRYAEAIELLSAIVDQPSLPGTLARFYLGQARLQFGIAELRQGRYTSAAGHLTAAREINPGSVALSRYLLVCHAGQRRFDLAIREIERTRDQGEADDVLPIRLAHAQVRDGQRQRAVETLEKAIQESPGRADYRFQLGLLHAAAEEFDPAVIALSEAVTRAPLEAEIRKNLGLALAAAGRARQAVEHLAIAQKLRPHDAYAALLLSLAVKADHAAETADGPLAVAPVPAEMAPADEAAIETLGDLLTKDPDFVEAFLCLPESEVDAEIFAMLAAILGRALEKHPDYADLHHHCARVYGRLGRIESAITEESRAVEINPRYVQALIQLGRLYVQADRSGAAIERLQAAIESGGDYPDVHFMLGELYREEGRTRRACTAYRRALALNSDYTSARRALEALATT